MNNELIERFLEALDETCFPHQINWNQTDLYIKGVSEALEKSKLKIIDVEQENQKA